MVGICVEREMISVDFSTWWKMGRKSVWIKAEFSFCSPLFIHLFSTYCPHVFLIFLHFFFHIVWIIFIKYQYKYRNIFFYVFSLFLSIDVLSMWYCLPDSLSYFSCNPETASQVTLASLGTVFQTALTVSLAFGSLLCVLAFGSLAMFKIYHG